MADKQEQPIMEESKMRNMADRDYREYLRAEEILFLDIHGVLRLTANGAPVATSQGQLDIFMEELKQYRPQMSGKRG